MKTSTCYINRKSLAFKEVSEFIDWWVASPCSERRDARTGVTPVKSYSSFVWASWQLICYLIGDERVGKIQATGRQCRMDLAARANHQHCNWWHKSQQAAAFSALYKTPGVVYPSASKWKHISSLGSRNNRTSVRVQCPCADARSFGWLRLGVRSFSEPLQPAKQQRRGHWHDNVDGWGCI